MGMLKYQEQLSQREKREREKLQINYLVTYRIYLSFNINISTSKRLALKMNRIIFTPIGTNSALPRFIFKPELDTNQMSTLQGRSS